MLIGQNVPEIREYGLGIRHADHVAPLSARVGTNLADKWRLLGRYSIV
jgi:hypothetical protein